jgi:phage internal scaffolding protein
MNNINNSTSCSGYKKNIGLSKRTRVQVTFTKPSLTKQAFKKECDINALMARWQRTGVLEHVKEFQGVYGDYTGVMSYQESLDRVLAADAAFMSLPSSVREKFGNDPHQFIEFMQDPNKAEERREMGLENPPTPSQPQEDCGKVEPHE